MPKILHCMQDVASGGVEQRRLTMARRLPADYRCALISTGVSPEFRKAFEGFGWTVHDIGRPKSPLDLSWYLKGIAIARKFRPDIVHGAVFEGMAMSSVIGTALPDAIVIAEETSDPQDRRWRGSLFLRLMLRRADRVVGVSYAVGRYLSEHLGVPAGKISVIPNGVELVDRTTEQEHLHLRQELNIAPNEFVVGSVGRMLDNHKRFSDIIAAAKILDDKGFVLKFVFIGDGPDRVALKDKVNELGLQKCVQFLGHRSDVRRYYDAMDVFVIASEREAFGLVVVEAMMAELAVVATKVGGLPEVLGEGSCGILIDRYSPDQIANALIHLHENREQARRLAKAGRERAIKHYSADRYISDVTRLYEELLSSKGVKRNA